MKRTQTYYIDVTQLSSGSGTPIMPDAVPDAGDLWFEVKIQGASGDWTGATTSAEIDLEGRTASGRWVQVDQYTANEAATEAIDVTRYDELRLRCTSPANPSALTGLNVQVSITLVGIAQTPRNTF